MSLIRTFVHRPVLVTMLMLALGGIGAYSYLQLPQEMFPKIEFPMITVMTRYEGAGPEEVEQLITKKLEDELSMVEGIKHLTSVSQQGMSLVIAEFYLEVNVDVAAADVRDKVNIVRNQLPNAADDPVVQKFDFNAEPIMKLAVSAPRPLREVFHETDQRIQDRLATVPGVAAVDLVGGEEREIHVLTNQQRLRAYGLSITDVAMGVASANLETPGGRISQNSREYNIRLRGKFTDLDQIRNMKVPLHNGGSIYLRDVAEVRDAFKDIRDKARADGKTCVGVDIQKRADGNTVAVDKAVRQQIAHLKKILPADYEIVVQDEQASWIVSSLDNVFGNMRTGIFLTAIALFLFLHSLRSTFIVALTMPIAVLATFIIMYLSGFSLNLMSMMGLAMTIGILVDNSVLVLENICRLLHLDYNPEEAAVKGTGDMAVAVVATTATNIVIFVPIAFMGGIIGQFFKDLGLTATFATICSLVVSFTLTPMLAGKLLTRKNTDVDGPGLLNRFGRSFDRGLARVKADYAGALRWTLRHRGWALLIVLGMFFGSICLLGFIGGEFITPMDQGKFMVTVEMPTGTRLEETDQAVARIEKILMDRKILPELAGFYASIGRVGGGFGLGTSQAVNCAQISVTLVGKDQRQESTSQIRDRLRPVLAKADIAGARIKILASEGRDQTSAPIQMDITGDDISRIRQFAQRAIEIIKDSARVPGAIDVDSNYRSGQPEIHIIPDREKCRDALVDTSFISQVVEASFEGTVVSEYREGAFDYDIRIRGDENSRLNIADVNKLTMMNQKGDLIPLPQLARIESVTGPSQLFRKDRQSLITISADVSGRSLAEVVKDIRTQMLPLQKEFSDCSIFFAGDTEMMEESFGRLQTAMIMALCLTYMLLAALLESFIEPIMIMVSLPLGMIGVLLVLFLMGGTFSIFSIMSMVILIGLVINNAIIVLNYVKILRGEGKERNEAFVEAGTTRLRPMLMTNLTTIAALIPLALGLGWAGELQAPMAMVQIGGLIAGGWIGLLIVPVIYTLYDDFINFLKRHLHHRKTAVVD